jgi:hypothetical protein
VSEARKISSRMIKSFSENNLKDFVASLLGKNGRFSAFKTDSPAIK